MTRGDIKDFDRSLKKVMRVVALFQGSLSPREKLVLQLGLRAAHMEEAIAAGEMARAEEHQKKLLTIAEALAAK